jgi:hypothetical protein
MTHPRDFKIDLPNRISDACYNISASLFVSADSCNSGNAPP